MYELFLLSGIACYILTLFSKWCKQLSLFISALVVESEIINAVLTHTIMSAEKLI